MILFSPHFTYLLSAHWVINESNLSNKQCILKNKNSVKRLCYNTIQFNVIKAILKALVFMIDAMNAKTRFESPEVF